MRPDLPIQDSVLRDSPTILGVNFIQLGILPHLRRKFVLRVVGRYMALLSTMMPHAKTPDLVRALQLEQDIRFTPLEDNEHVYVVRCVAGPNEDKI